MQRKLTLSRMQLDLCRILCRHLAMFLLPKTNIAQIFMFFSMRAIILISLSLVDEQAARSLAKKSCSESGKKNNTIYSNEYTVRSE